MAVIINKNVNRIFEDDDLKRIFRDTIKNNQMKAQQDRWKWNKFSNVKIQSLNVPIEDQDGESTYTYIVDVNTTKKLLSDIKRILENSSFKIDNEFNITDVNDVHSTDDYEPIGKLETKLLTNAGLSAHINNPYKKGNRIYVNLGISSIRIDSPDFDRFYQPNKFIVYLESNILYKIDNSRAKRVVDLDNLIKKNQHKWSQSEFNKFSKSLKDAESQLNDDDSPDKARYKLIDNIRSTINNDIDNNWVFKDFTVDDN